MNRASRRKYHYFYKTTCIITNRYYYGIHSTDNLDDCYIGSGKRLWYSINKHGRENHKIEKLEFFNTREKLKEKEIEIVNEALLKDPLCMNLVTGGTGGYFSKEIQIKRAKASSNAKIALMKNDPLYREKIKESSRQALLNRLKKGEIFKGSGFKNKTHSEETKKKMSLSQQGKQKEEKNSQYGTCWITNEEENKKIKKTDSIPSGWKLGRTFKTFNPNFI